MNSVVHSPREKGMSHSLITKCEKCSLIYDSSERYEKHCCKCREIYEIRWNSKPHVCGKTQAEECGTKQERQALTHEKFRFMLDDEETLISTVFECFKCREIYDKRIHHCCYCVKFFDSYSKHCQKCHLILDDFESHCCSCLSIYHRSEYHCCDCVGMPIQDITGMKGSVTRIGSKILKNKGCVVKFNSYPMIQSYFSSRFLSTCHLKVLYGVSGFPVNLRRKILSYYTLEKCRPPLRQTIEGREVLMRPSKTPSGKSKIRLSFR
jgi:hypothetical protein